MRLQQTTHCTITSYRIEDPIDHSVMGKKDWIAIASTHACDYADRIAPHMSRDDRILAGAVLRSLEGRGVADTEIGAIRCAIEVMLEQLEALRERGGDQ